MGVGVKLKDLPNAQAYTDEDYVPIDDGSKTQKIKISELVRQIVNSVRSLIKKDVDEQLTSFDTDITNALNKESDTREKADTTLQNNIDNEKTQRLLNVNSLRKDVDTFKGVSAINGNGQTKVFTVEHNLSTKDLIVQAYSPIGGEELKFSVVRNLNSLELTFETAPQGEVRIVYMAVNSWSSEQLPFNLPFE